MSTTGSNTYAHLSPADKRTVDMTILGAVCVVQGTEDPSEMHALRHAHMAVDDAVTLGHLTAERAQVLKEAMTDTVADLFVRLLDAERTGA